MRIAQVAPLSESVPPKMYGGTERVVSYLTEELVRRGHDVTLFASGDSETSARLVAPCSTALWRSTEVVFPDVYNTLLLEQVGQEAKKFDIIHFHFDFIHYPLMRRLGVPHVTTMHGRLDLPDLVPLYKMYSEMPVISISDAQRAPLPWLNWQRTIYHGLPDDLLTFNEKGGDYLAFIGRTSPEKGLDTAIEIAKRAGMKLKISAAVQPANRDYFERVIRPLLDHPLIEFVGETGGKEKDEFLGGARAVLFPINWPEPFGLVMIEAMAVGTPVIAFRRGSVPEVITDGVSGFIVDSIDEAVEAAWRVSELSRHQVRRSFEARFTVGHMVDQHLEVYERLISEKEKAVTRIPHVVSVPRLRHPVHMRVSPGHGPVRHQSNRDIAYPDHTGTVDHEGLDVNVRDIIPETDHDG